jgi:hypothetical protein
MKNRVQGTVLLTFMVLAFAVPGARAQGEFRLPIRVMYMSGPQNVSDWHNKLPDDEGWNELNPIGFCASPFYQFSGGLRLGAAVGPWTGANGFFPGAGYSDLSVGMDCGYTFDPQARTTAFVNAGIRYHWVSGDNVEGTSPGFLLSGGVELLRNLFVGITLEIGYDFSTVKLADDLSGRSDDVQSGGWLVSLGMEF